MKTKLLLAFVASLFSFGIFAQKLGQEMAVYAEKKGNDYYLIRLVQDQAVPKVYVYSNGETKPYKTYTELKDVVMDFPGMMSSNNSTKEELVSVLKKDNHFYEITSQRKDPKNFEKTTVTVYEVFNGQKRIVEEYGSIYELVSSPYKDAIFIDIKK
ncbi:hypothetical protein ACNFU2_02290 [Chryseobacterium sp. PTM-20240506]|uniref:hypothetical protein n=1 Tax=unclassified Chryseobacterium TaxID=2593645 RepID=UPI001551653F|nr:MULTISPECIES: hypothetical protein [unclassified Chryseobacterium]MDC8103686.1 hypothetical protein [Chryseobacterium sp. B21-037]MDQ1803294.1 hypothetical protein [Chryseobacterium sp. CKR4-1]